MARDAEVCVIRRDDDGWTGALAALIHKSIVAWGSDSHPGLGLVPSAKGVTFAALKEIRRVVVILINHSRDRDYVLIDHHKSILPRGSDIARAS
jgi:hypothetical protein